MSPKASSSRVARLGFQRNLFFMEALRFKHPVSRRQGKRAFGIAVVTIPIP